MAADDTNGIDRAMMTQLRRLLAFKCPTACFHVCVYPIAVLFGEAKFSWSNAEYVSNRKFIKSRQKKMNLAIEEC